MKAIVIAVLLFLCQAQESAYIFNHNISTTTETSTARYISAYTGSYTAIHLRNASQRLLTILKYDHL